MEEDCIFCKIRSGEIPSEVLYRDEECFVIRDIEPKAPVHLLVMPNQHITYLRDLAEEHHGTIGAMFAAARKMAAREGTADNGYRLVVNQGDDAGQVVPHLHLHLLAGRHLGEMG